MSHMSRRREVDPGYDVGDVSVIRITDDALLVQFGSDEFWVPKSQIMERSEVDDTTLIDDGGELVVTTWFAGKRGWL